MCETHDPTGEPDAVNPPVRFGERRLETEPWRGVRHRHCESCREQLPPSAYRHRASRRLYSITTQGPNTARLGEIAADMCASGAAPDPALFAHVSPLGWEHIHLTGEYRWPA